jgi:hypothetical protein
MEVVGRRLAGKSPSIRMVHLPQGLKEKWDLADEIPDNLSPAQLIADAKEFTPNEEPESSDAAEAGASLDLSEMPHADALLKIAETASLFHDEADRKAFADIMVNGHRETWATDSRGFEYWLKGQFYERTGKAARNDAFQQAVATIDAKATYEGSRRQIFTRIGPMQERFISISRTTNGALSKSIPKGGG